MVRMNIFAIPSFSNIKYYHTFDRLFIIVVEQSSYLAAALQRVFPFCSEQQNDLEGGKGGVLIQS